jgi:hypothetical protein
VRARRIRIFGGVDLRTDKGWSELLGSIRTLAELTFSRAAAKDGQGR